MVTLIHEFALYGPTFLIGGYPFLGWPSNNEPIGTVRVMGYYSALQALALFYKLLSRLFA